ncbi:MAG: helix-turn-helix transcriptional regulator [Myxococcota bacterium]
MARVPLLRVDSSGVVTAENEAASALLGPSVGSACCEAVSASSAGGLACRPDCARGLHREGRTSDLARVGIRGEPAQLVCSPLGDEVVVAIVPARAEVPEGALLSPREREIVALIAQGLTNARIGRRLGVSASTVRTHVERLLEKLHARSRAEAVARAHATGQLD